MLQDIESCHRLKTALGKVDDEKLKGLQSQTEMLEEDPFPEGRIRLAIMKEGGEVADRMHYLRSRMRLSRAAATLVPALFVALELSIAASEPQRYVFTALVAITYLLVFISSVTRKENKPPKTTWLTEKEYRKLSSRKKRHVNEYLDSHIETDGGKGTAKLGWQYADTWDEPVISGLIIMFVLGIGVAFMALMEGKNQELLLFPVIGIIVALLTGWVWWRVSKTFYTLLMSYHETYMKKRSYFKLLYS
jgi:hypothetical protein